MFTMAAFIQNFLTVLLATTNDFFFSSFDFSLHECAVTLYLPTGVLSPIDDEEYAAIKTIHKQLDDNADGSVDLSESAEVGIMC